MEEEEGPEGVGMARGLSSQILSDLEEPEPGEGEGRR